MIVLGIGGVGSGAHDASAALVVDGRLVAAVEEERFTRVKHFEGVPLEAIRWCLAQAGIGLADVDRLAFPERPYRTGRDSVMAWADPALVESLLRRRAVRRRALWHKRALDLLGGRHWPFSAGLGRQTAAGLRTIREEFGPLPPLTWHSHHESHAAATYLLSGVDEATVVTIDGIGGLESAVIWAGKGARLRPVASQSIADSLGCFYYDCTVYAGLGEYGEGRMMGLASYGDPARLEAEVSRLFDAGDFPWTYRQRPCERLLGFPPRGQEAPTGEPWVHFAAAVQGTLEKAVQSLVDKARTVVGVQSLCLGGGVALNCSSNGKLVHGKDARDLFIFPAAGDAGLSVGAALLSAAAAGDDVNRRLPDAYLGPAATPKQVERELAAHADVIHWERCDVVERAARRLADGEVLGWVQGRMEFGPRALGARSILADPREASTRDRVNRLKGREPWRPFAPVVLEERAGEFFELDGPSPFMLLGVPVRPGARQRLPAVTHVDGTARPQTAGPASAPRLRALLAAFERHAGIPVLLNTSFNTAAEPIVCSPQDAIRSFLEMGLDALVIEEFLVTKITPPAC